MLVAFRIQQLQKWQTDGYYCLVSAQHPQDMSDEQRCNTCNLVSVPTIPSSAADCNGLHPAAYLQQFVPYHGHLYDSLQFLSPLRLQRCEQQIASGARPAIHLHYEQFLEFSRRQWCGITGISDARTNPSYLPPWKHCRQATKFFHASSAALVAISTNHRTCSVRGYGYCRGQYTMVYMQQLLISNFHAITSSTKLPHKNAYIPLYP